MAMNPQGITCILIFCVAFLCFSPRGEAGNEPGFISQNAIVPDVGHTTWALRLPKNAPVVVNGVVSFDSAGTGAGSMLYPAPGIAGLLVAIAVHGAIESSAKKAQKTKMQEAANQVLVPYQDVLAEYKIRSLMQDAVARMPFGNGKRLLEPSESPGTDWLVDSVPTFQITQDQHAFIVDNTIAIYAPSSLTVPVYRNTVHAVSRSMDDETAAFWTANQGEKLKGELADLYSESIGVALQALADGPTGSSNPFKTIRYMEGDTEKIERAQPLYEQCNRIVIKTLRGTIMSIPFRPKDATNASASQCADW